ncbi:ATPase AAA [Spirochaetia bacterium]|nr:ATPase AAA [Spirochaetia bacterium]GHU33057.1 ATPase AAA [Spirochaetia bacterium]
MQQQSLFCNDEKNIPLSSKLRPVSLDEYVGQQHLLGNGKILRQLLEQDIIPSMIFWGPPGVGKTTLAQVIANKTKAHFISFSAAVHGIKEIKELMNSPYGERTIIFIDEIHRFNKAQQDAFLPYVENGSIILIGATTENPSFEVNSALLSRCKVFILNLLSADELKLIVQRAVSYYSSAKKVELLIPDPVMSALVNFANGDARILLNTLELIANNRTDSKIIVTEKILEQCINKKMLLYDKNGEEHYNIISALHKSMRNSDVHAAIYWLARLLESGEDPLYVARRIIRFASEDIGMADSRALEIAVAAYQACHFIGMPECNVTLCHAVTYCSLAPKSNALYVAYQRARGDALHTFAEPVPLVIRNAPTSLMKDLHYGEGYKYAHDTDNKITDMQCLPDTLSGRKYYQPTNQGTEIRVKERMDEIEVQKAALSHHKEDPDTD